MKKTFYLTTPIYYPNARPHVGSAYTTIVCDVIARYKRMCGYDVAFLTGTDEHGEKLERAAAAAGMSPPAFVAEKRKLFIALWEKLGIPVKVYPDSTPEALRFIYTDHPDHVISVQRLLLRAKANGYIYTQRYEGRYCVWDERYVSDNTDPVNCDICGRPAELISEDNYFFKLSKFEDKLKKLYDDHPDFVKPDYRMNEVKSFVKSGLRDISVSRSRLKWGVPWPDDPNQVFYVWYDALTSYMTGIGYAQREDGGLDFKKYWRNVPGESELVHMIGKDILRFHAIYWPSFIMAAYPEQIAKLESGQTPDLLPSKIFAHGWIYYEQDKMSKSKGNVVYPEPLIDAVESFGAPGNDALRYYLLREAPFGQDTSFSYEGFVKRYNSDLANDLGNLASRALTMIHQFCAGEIPPRPNSSGSDPAWDVEGFYPVFRAEFDAMNFSDALALVAVQVSSINKKINEVKPWVLAKSESEEDKLAIQRILYQSADFLRTACILLYPILPTSMTHLWRQLGCKEHLGELKNQQGNTLSWGALNPGTKIGKPEPIFPRLDKTVALAKLEEMAEADRNGDKSVGALREAPLRANSSETPARHEKSKEKSRTVESENAKPSTPATEAAPASPAAATPEAAAAETPKITIDDFLKVELRAGEVKAAERIPGATKLLKLQVDIGTEVRQICAGIAEYYEPEQLIGKKVVIVANLAPRKMRGVESNGMIVAASAGENGRPILATFGEDVPNGAKLR